MKVKLTLVIMSLVGTLSHSSKLLRIPRVYNAFVTSNEDLQPSQTYPVLTPVVQSLQYSLPRYVSSNVHRALVVPNQVQYSDTRSYSYSVHNTVKEDYTYYQYNIVETGLPFQVDLSTISMTQEWSPEEPILFRLGNAANIGDDRYFYVESSPLESSVNDVQRAQRYNGPSQSKGANVDGSSRPELNDKPAAPTEAEEPKTDPSFNHYVVVDDAVKNNRPKDRSIVDVPPPPIPIRRKPHKKPDTSRPEEYPPPAVGFI